MPANLKPHFDALIDAMIHHLGDVEDDMGSGIKWLERMLGKTKEGYDAIRKEHREEIMQLQAKHDAAIKKLKAQYDAVAHGM